MLRPFVALVVPLATAILAGCDSFDVVDKSKFDVADKSKQVVISKEEYEQLKAAAALGKQVGRYQIHREGFRTWRLDTATGHTCLLLTTEEDWKNPKTKLQVSCAEEDWSEAQERHRLYPTLFDELGNPIPQKH